MTDVLISAYIPKDILMALCNDDVTDIRISIGNTNIDKSFEYMYSYKRLRKMFDLMRDQK